MQDLLSSLTTITLTEDKDKWSYTWGSTFFSSAKNYKALTYHPVVNPASNGFGNAPASQSTKSSSGCCSKIDLAPETMRRRNMVIENYNCVLCSSLVDETLEHLFLHCDFAKQCWSFLRIDILPGSTFPEIVSTFKIRLQSEFFMVAIILMSWSIWTARNDLTFKGLQPNMQNCKRNFFKELKLVLLRVKPSLLPNFELWIHSLSLS